MSLATAEFRQPAGHMLLPGIARAGDRPVQGHLLFVADGMVSIASGGMLWGLWPQRALWVPASADYQIHSRGDAEIVELALDSEIELPPSNRLIEISPLFRELIIEAGRQMAELCDGFEQDCIQGLIISRLRTAPGRRNAGVRLPADSRLRRICNAIIADPSDNRTIDDWAVDIGMSRRTLTRRFREETGLSFSIWRQQARLQEAVTRLEQGQPITTIAFDIGYESPGSFSTAFRQTFGITPSRFLSGN
jgi:AraC-like DNA-binding protein